MFLKKYFLILFIFLLIPLSLSAQDSDIKAKSLQDASGIVDSVAVEGAGLPGGSVDSIASQVIDALFSLVGVIFFILMIYGGYIWMMAKGNEQDVDKAKNIIRAAIIGLIVVVGAYAITAFVLRMLIPT